MFGLRVAFLSVLRFCAILALIIFSQRFEVSPLPEWTLYAFVFLMDGLVTYVAARRVFRGMIPSTRETAVVTAAFIGSEFLLQVLFVMWYGGRSLREVVGGLQWQMLVLMVWYGFCVWGAAHTMRRKQALASLPEGLDG